MEKPINNSEILFIYEAKNCNPNGDPDDENRPRIDRRTNVNLVTDVRLKRFFRNYIIATYGEQFIWVSTVDGKHVRADERLEKISSQKKPEEVLKSCIDARLFGATIPVGKGEKAKGKSYAYTGPVQFTWGYSLHPVEYIDSPSITSVFTGRAVEEGVESYGTIGKDWRLYYSLLAFYGVVNGARAKHSMAREFDIKILDNLLWRGLTMDATTRSKIGHWPHLYLRVECNDDFLLGDLRRLVKAKYEEENPIRDFGDIELDFRGLIKKIAGKTQLVNKVYVRESDECTGRYGITKALKEAIGEKVKELPHKIKITKDSLRIP